MTPTKFSIFRYYAKEYTRMNKKRATIIVSSLFAGALVAAACTATDSTVEGTAIAETTLPAVAPVADTYTAPTATADEDRFITLLESQDFDYGGDEQLAIDTGLAACEALDSGVGVAALISVIVGEGYGGYDAGTFLGATVYALCTEHVSTVEAFLESVN